MTKYILADAMKQLMEKKPFRKISVGEICDLCGMNRKSFYYHFKDKYDLVNWVFKTEIFNELRATYFDDCWNMHMALFTYLYDNRKFYVNALGVDGQNSFRDYLSESWSALMLPYMPQYFDDPETQKKLAGFFGDAFMVGVAKWLMYNPDITPAEYLKLIRF